MKKLLVILLLFPCQTFSQTKHLLDSIKKEIAHANQDTNLVKLLITYSENINDSDTKEALITSRKALELSQKLNYKSGLAESYNNLAMCYVTLGKQKEAVIMYRKALRINRALNDYCGVGGILGNIGYQYRLTGDYDSARYYYEKTIETLKQCSDKKYIAYSLVNMGIVLDLEGDYTGSMEYYMQAIDILERIKDLKGVSATYLNVGIIHYRLKDYKNAILYHRKSAELKKGLGDKYGMSLIYNNIGSFYLELENLDSALYYLNLSLELKEELLDKKGIGMVLTSIGRVYNKMNDYKQAERYFQKALPIKQELGDKSGLMHLYIGLAEMYNHTLGTEVAIRTAEKAHELALHLGDPREQQAVAYKLAQYHKENKTFEQAFEYLHEYEQIRDSIMTKERINQIEEMNTKYETEKKELENEKLKEISKKRAAEAKQERFQKLLYGTGFGTVGIFALLVLIGFVQKRKANKLISQQKKEVEYQKELVDEKNQEITDSITYAKRIQEAILPQDRIVKEYLKESFILYKPKDIVAGDFYWMERVEDIVIFAAADCTGHGVPGAMVSVVCHNALNHAVREFKLTDPAAILDKVSEIVTEQFATGEHEIQDGMDIALCSLNNHNKLQYAGANNPLWLVRNGELIETKADKQPIGKYAKRKPFTNHMIELQNGDSIYIFSDGYIDQFGGEKGKKFKAKAFKELLLSMQDEPMEKQRSLIDEAFEEWKGNLGQIDDVCIIGVRV